MITVRDIPIEQIRPGSNQARKRFDADALSELAESIRESGIVQPVVLRSSGNGFELLAGERRWRAAQQAGLRTVPALVRDDLDPVEAQVVGLVENLQRESLTPMETAHGLRRLSEMLDLTHEALGRRVGKSRSYVTNFLRLLSLEADVQTRVDAGDLSMGHARALVGLSPARQRQLAHAAVAERWTVRHLERQAALQRKTTDAPTKPPEWRQLEQGLAELFACPVVVSADQQGRGEVRLRFHSLDELDGILERFGYRE
jgi:ParB family chromosome partitioning protein